MTRAKGRKRFLLVDTLGLVLGAMITPASTLEREGAQLLLARVLGWFTWLRLLWVDGGYSGDAFAHWVSSIRAKLKVGVVKRSDTAKGFNVLPCRWVVERTFGWLMRSRRLVRDYETTETSAEGLDHDRNDACNSGDWRDCPPSAIFRQALRNTRPRLQTRIAARFPDD